jgi:hypothetical protein
VPVNFSGISERFPPPRGERGKVFKSQSFGIAWDTPTGSDGKVTYPLCNSPVFCKKMYPGTQFHHCAVALKGLFSKIYKSCVGKLDALVNILQRQCSLKYFRRGDNETFLEIDIHGQRICIFHNVFWSQSYDF